MLLLAAGGAAADDAVGPTFRVQATVDPDLRVVRGTLTAERCACAFVDPLARLELPEDDRTRQRTFPGKAVAGTVEFDVVPGQDGLLRFTARLPERYGEVGAVDGWGLRAAGGWYPQPVDGGGQPVVGRWTVEVRAEGEAVVLNGAVGEGAARWEGETDRVALAVVPRAVVTTEGGITFVERRRPEPRVHRAVTALLADWPLAAPPRLTVVEGMDLRRLTHAAPGMVLLSDRAFRLTGPLARYHDAPVREALVAAAVPRGDGWERDLVAASLVDDLPAPSPTKLLGWLSWNPVIDALLHDGSLPYYPEIFDEAFPEPPDLVDAVGGRLPGKAAARQLEAASGRDAVRAVVARLLDGAPLAEAGLPPALLDAWSRRYDPDQNYRVEVARGEPPRIVREAPPEAPAEVVSVTVDGEPRPAWITPPGPATLTLDTAAARSVTVDPLGSVRERDRVDNRWPPRWTVVLSGGIYDLSPTQGNFALDGVAILRKQGDTRNLYAGGLSHDAQDLVGVWVEYLRYLGPLLDRRLRTQRVWASFGPSLLDPSYRPTDDGAVAVGGSAGYTLDTRQGDEASSGHRLSLTVGGGFVPGSQEVWASSSLGGVQLVPLSARSVLAARLGLGWASGDVEHRLLSLGGANNLRSVVDHEAIGNERVVGNLELRQALFRSASVPLPLLWLSEIQLAPGVEAGAVWRDGGGRAVGIGATLGVHVVVDAFGARPVFVGTSLAAPLWQDGYPPGGLQAYLDFTQAF